MVVGGATPNAEWSKNHVPLKHDLKILGQNFQT